jgi:hypothetical protein
MGKLRESQVGLSLLSEPSLLQKVYVEEPIRPPSCALALLVA